MPTLRELAEVGRSQGLDPKQIAESIAVRYGQDALWQHPDKPLPDLGTAVAVQGSQEGPKPQPPTFTGPKANISGPIEHDSPHSFFGALGRLGLSRPAAIIGGDITTPVLSPSQEYEVSQQILAESRKPQESARGSLSRTKQALKDLLLAAPEFAATTLGHIAGATGAAFNPNVSMAMAAPGDEFHAMPAAEAIKNAPEAKASTESLKKAIAGAHKEVSEGNRAAMDKGILANVQPSTARAATGMRDFAYTMAGMNPTGYEHLPPGERLLGAFTKGAGEGQQVLSGALGGTAAMAQHPYQALVGDPVGFSLAALPIASGVKAALGAGLRSAEVAGGGMGRIASGLLKAGEYLDPATQAGRGAEYLKSLTNLYPEQATISALLDEAEANGSITAEQRAAIARQAQPSIPYRIGGHVGEAAQTAGKFIGDVGSGALKGGTLGALIGGPAGATIGAGLGMAGPTIGSMAFQYAPEQMAWAARMLKDPNIQSTEVGTRIARDVGTEASNVGRAVANLQREMGGMVGAGDVELAPGGEKISRLPITQQVRSVTTEGKLQRLPKNVERGMDVSQLRAQERGTQFVNQQISQRVPSEAEARQVAVDQAKAEQEALGRTPAEREFTAGHEYPMKTQKIVAETTNPQVEAIVQDIHKLQNQLGGKLSLDESRRLVAEPLQNDSITLLRERGFRGKVAKDLVRQISGATAEAEGVINEWLYNMTEHALSGDAISYELHLPDGNVITIPQAIETAVNDFLARPDGKQIMNRVRAGAMDQIAQHLQRQVEDSHRARALDAEQRRFALDQLGPNEPNKVVPGMIRRILRGEAEPQMLQDANLIAQEIRANPDVFAAAVEASDPNNPIRPSREMLLSLADRLEKNYAPIGADIAQFMAQNGLPAMQRMYAHKGYMHTAQLAIDYSRSIHNMGGFARAVSVAKRNVVSRNLKATINNAGQNLSLTSFVEGKNPISTMADVAEAGLQVRDYYTGAPMSEADRLKWRAGAKAGAFDANQLETEAKAFGKGKPSQGMVRSAVRGAGKIMDYSYQLGDQVFKANTFSKTYDQVMGDFSKLSRKVTYDLNRGLTTIERVGDMYEVSSPGKGKVKVSLDSDVMRDIAAECGAKVANGFYFNMHEKPGLVMWASSIGGGAGSMINPFIHWPLLAMDLPGKKGLVARVMAYDGTAPMFTNDPALLARKAKRAMEVGARRLIMNQAMAATLDDRPMELQQVLGRTPRDVSTAILRNVLDPTLNARVSPGNNEWFAMTDTTFRLGLAGLAMFVDGEDFAKPPKTKLERVRRDLFKKLHTGELAEPADILKFANVNGGLWYDTFKELEKTDYSNNPTAWHKLAMSSLRMAIGGTAADLLVDVPVGLISGPGSQWTSRQMSGTETAHPKAQDWLDFTLRATLGMGAKLVNMDERSLKQYEKTVQTMEKEILQPAIDEEHMHDSLARIAKDRGDMETMQQELALRKEATRRANSMRFVMREIEASETARIQKIRALIKKKVPNAQFQELPSPAATQE